MPPGLSLADHDAVLFDIDGTLVDSLPMLIPGLADGIEKFAGVRPSDQEIQSIVGLPMAVQLQRYLPSPVRASELEAMIDYMIARFDVYKDLERVFTPALETLRACREAGLRTALVTSKNSRELAWFLQRFPGARWVDATVCASDVLHPKPAPDSALAACRKLGVASDRALMIGDSVFDLRCAQSAGLPFVAVGYGAATPEALQAEDPDLYFGTAEELLAWALDSLQYRHASKENSTRLDSADRNDPSAGAA